MFDQEDGELNVVIGVLFGVIALVIAFVIGLGVYSLRGQNPAPAGAVQEASVEAAGIAVVEVEFVETAEVGEALLKIYFDTGSSSLPADTTVELERIVAELGSRSETVALISGFHDESGSAEANAAIARDRAVAVGQALVAAGAPAERVQLRRPAVTLGDGDAAEARRVEIRVQ
ncbi:OmpA family protein [Pseudothauera nasutitermitis]|uniref:OmpA family protein n=1 Tax=Pseudothauera nasutitermitis TaxID=2565930 RepID=A0A4S4B0W8_9RHOO|nr:OmpA family protein [Pseudothauera nasutitermitis]THF66191.1 OmpA family protein [Pseudothauera nasutitermitis]